MKIEKLTLDEKYKCINEFKTRCYFLYRLYRINKVLFEDNTEIYNDLTSPKLINGALIEHLLLQFHLVTDKANFGEIDKNLSIFFFLEWSWKPDVETKLKALAGKLKFFVDFKKSENPRHKLLAHWDVATILKAKEPLGSFSLGDEVNFFDNLNEFIKIMQNSMGYSENWDMFTEEQADEIKLLRIIQSGSSNNPKI
jgi:hypothetical protein